MEKDIEKAQRLNEVYKYVFAHYDIKSQKDFADRLKIQRTGLSAAMNGAKANLTKNLFTKICAAFPGIFNIDYLLTGKGKLLADEIKNKERPKQLESIDNGSLVNALIAAKDESISCLKREIRLNEEIENLKKIITEKDARIKELEHQLASFKMSDMDNYPFTIGASDDRNQPKIKPNVSPSKNAKSPNP